MDQFFTSVQVLPFASGKAKIPLHILISEASGRKGHDEYGRTLTAMTDIQIHSLIF